MGETYAADATYAKTDFTKQPFLKGEYDHCSFNHCNLSGCDLSGTRFIDCHFAHCNLSLAKLIGTVLRDVLFRDCKMLGLHFEQCNAFGLTFSCDGCTLDHSSFYQVKIKKTRFKNTQLKEVDLTECDLSGSSFEACDFWGAHFEQTILEKADFRTSVNYSINPEQNRIKKARFSLSEIAGLLDKYDIDIDKRS